MNGHAIIRGSNMNDAELLDALIGDIQELCAKYSATLEIHHATLGTAFDFDLLVGDVA